MNEQLTEPRREFEKYWEEIGRERYPFCDMSKDEAYHIWVSGWCASMEAAAKYVTEYMRRSYNG